MALGNPRAAALLVVFLCLPVFPLEAAHDLVDEREVSWAYGTVVDSVTVMGNKNTRTHAILREMETQPGEVLDRETFRRDMRFLGDMTPFSGIEASADSLSPGHCAIRLRVRERAEILIKAVLPQFKYDFERGFTYGVRWNDHNFRGRLEDVSVSYSRSEQGDDNVNLGWSAPWLGWRHVSVGTGVSYYNRGDFPVEIGVLERLGLNGYVGIPLTDSRVTFSQLLLSLTLDRSRTGGREEDPRTAETGDKELALSPLVGYYLDSRDSRLRPGRGWVFYTSVRATCPLDDGRDVYYRVNNEVRRFVGVGESSVLALLSNFDYQFGDFPSYSYLRLGGPGSLRGHPTNRFKGHHRWYQTIEWRYQLIPRFVFSLPIIHEFDVGVGVVTFVDTGIVWSGSDDFELDNFHGTGGVGLQLFSPIQDLVRFDFGFSARGDYRLHAATGIRF